MSRFVSSKTWNSFLLLALLVGLFGALHAPSPARASSVEDEYSGDERHSPIAVEIGMKEMPAVGQQVGVSIVVSSSEEALATEVNIVSSEGLKIVGQSHFVIDLRAREAQTLTTEVMPVAVGNHSVAANVLHALGNGDSWGDSAAAYFYSGDGSASPNFFFQGDPASGGGAPGPGDVIMPDQQAFPDGTMALAPFSDVGEAPTDDALPGEPSSSSSEGNRALAAGNLTIRGTIGMTNPKGLWATPKMLVQLLYGNGVVATSTYSDWDGSFVFTVPNPGKFQLRFWTYYKHSSMTDSPIKVVADGDTTGRFLIAGYNFTIGAYGPYSDGETVDVGYWQPDPAWAGSRAWWVYDALLDGFFYPSSAVPPGMAPGSRMPDGVVVEWSAGSDDGAYYKRSQRKVHLADYDANSPHTILHEYGHAIMDTAYRKQGGAMSVNDCPKGHRITLVGGNNCTWLEGWATFYAMATLADPIYKWGCTLPCAPQSVNLEIHAPGDYWAVGDQVEGNAAASLWDFIDAYDDGWDMTNAVTVPPWKIWEIVNTHISDDFNDFMWVMTSYYNSTNTLATLYQNTIDYGWQYCGDWYSEPSNHYTQAHLYAYPPDQAYLFSLCTENDVDYLMLPVVAGRTYTIWTKNLATTTTGMQVDTTLTLYAADGVTQLAFDDNGGDSPRASKIVYTATADATLYVATRQANGLGQLGFTYDIDFAES